MSRVIPYVMRPERQREVRYVPPKTPPSPRPATRSPGGPLRGHAAAPPGQHDVHSPQPCFAASTTGKNQYVRPRAPCTSAPPHADGGKWGGLDRDVVSRTAAARCLGSSEGRPARPKFVSQRERTTDPDGPPSPPRARAALVRTGWPETAVGPPAAPRPAAHLHGGSRAALDGARSSAPGSSVPVVHGEAGRVAQRGRAVLPGGCARGSPSGRGFRRAGWPGPPRGSPGGAPSALPGAARRGGAVRGHFHFSRASPEPRCSSPVFARFGADHPT